MWSVVKKELRGYFNSAIAVIFLAAFLAVALYTFFWREHFFARGLAAYGADELRRLAGKKTSQIESTLGYRGLDEAVHRDDLAML